MKIKFIVSIIIIVVCLPACSNNYFRQKERTDNIADDINQVMSGLKNSLIKSVDFSKNLLISPENFQTRLYPDAKYEFYNNTIFHNPVNTGNGKFFYTGYVPVTDKEKKKILVMEHMIPELKRLCKQYEFSEFIIQSYLITHDSLFVFFPYLELESYIPPKRNIKDREGWTIHSPENNPLRNAVWSPPYLDTTGKGFMVTVSHPVYNSDFLEAFMGIDITLKTIKKRFLSEIEDKILLIDKNTSQLFAMSESASELQGIGEIKAFKYLDMVDSATVAGRRLPDNLILDKTQSELLKNIWAKLKKGHEFTVTSGGQTFKIYSKLIEETQWYIVLVG